MILSTFRARIRQRLRDESTNYSDAYLNEAIDEAISELWPIFMDRVPHFYRKETIFTGITDAVAATSNEQYTLPTDFRSRGTLRRNDLPNKPAMRYIQPNYIDDWRYRLVGPYTPDPQSPSQTFEVWSIFDKTNFIIIPAPSATTFKYKLQFFRKHTTASADGNTVDIPDEAVTLLISKIALDILTDDDDPSSKLRFAHFQNQLTVFQGVTPHRQTDVVPEVERWWQ